MSSPRHPFRINVGFIIHEEVGYTSQFPFEFDKITLGGDLVLQDFSGVVDVGRTPQGLVVTGHFSATTPLECVRCLKTYEHRLEWDLTELYAFTAKSLSESELLVPEDAKIDLEPVIRDYAILEIPINPIHSPDCKGLCPVCGQDLNVRDCGHRPEQDESPFSALNKLL